MTQHEGVELMMSSTTENEWNANCDKIKSAHNGDYPEWWYQGMILSGLMHMITSTFRK